MTQITQIKKIVSEKQSNISALICVICG